MADVSHSVRRSLSGNHSRQDACRRDGLADRRHFGELREAQEAPVCKPLQ